MTRILFVFLCAATLTITAFNQTQNPEDAQVCDLSLTQAPAIRGIRLGMRPDEWLKLFPGSAQDEKLKAILYKPPTYPEYGKNSLIFESSSASAHTNNAFRIFFGEGFSGIDKVYLDLFDNQIIGFSIFDAPYPGVDNPWDSAKQLTPIFSNTYNLPQAFSWGKNGHRATLRRAGFELASNPTSAYLKSKYDPEEIIRQRSEADKPKRRAAFKA
ncbi:MAG: hypothetical protein J2P21_18455 [Chloracidobacterium sp.]|nr:hypothetical protein [Chloracidobacterium sp.]